MFRHSDRGCPASPLAKRGYPGYSIKKTINSIPKGSRGPQARACQHLSETQNSSRFAPPCCTLKYPYVPIFAPPSFFRHGGRDAVTENQGVPTDFPPPPTEFLDTATRGARSKPFKGIQRRSKLFKGFSVTIFFIFPAWRPSTRTHCPNWTR